MTSSCQTQPDSGKARIWFYCILAFAASCPSGQVVAQGAGNEGQLFIADYDNASHVIRLPLDDANADWLRQHKASLEDRVLYISSTALSQVDAPQVSIGFFATEEQARQALDASAYTGNNHSIGQASQAEYQALIGSTGQEQGTATQTAYYVFPVGRQGSPDFDRAADEALAAARVLYNQAQYDDAIGLYSLLARIGEPATAAWAQELLGLSYEKAGRQDLAIASYVAMQEKFPDNNGISRVQQRLRSLQTATANSQPLLNKSVAANEGPTFRTSGVIGQYQRQLSRNINDLSDDEIMNLLTTDFDVRSTMQIAGHSLFARLNGFWIRDKLDSGDSELRLKRVYADYKNLASGLQIQLGRQKDSDVGVFTSFDGLTVRYPLGSRLELAASAGKPVYFSDIYRKFDYSFYSINSTFEASENWQFNAYFNLQKLNSVTDREALGFNVQYNKDKISSSAHLDYDIAFAELNSLQLNAGYRFTESFSMNAAYGKQRSPFLTASNILIGQADLDLELYLLSRDNMDTLLEYALSRTSLNQFFTLSVNSRLSSNMQLLANYYHSSLSDIPSYEFLQGVSDAPDIRSAFQQQSFGSQLMIDNLFFDFENTTLGFRINSGSTNSSNQVFVKERYRIGNRFFLSPQLTFTAISFDANEEQENRYRSSLVLLYKPRSNWEINLEVGNEQISRKIRPDTYSSTYVFAGYRFSF